MDIASLMYPHVTRTPAEYEKMYPPRQLEPEAMVTRFAPSPTGFVHLGGVYASLISKRLAEQSGGVFYLRIEDTDKKREVAGGRDEIITTLKNFDVSPTEGYVDVDTEKGNYGPYIQSQRLEIYDTYAKYLVEKGYAYPCFCSEEELAEIAAAQERQGVKKKGYYGQWARDRHLTPEEVKAKLDQGQKFVLRVKAPENPGKVRVPDLIKGPIELEANFVDMVLIKSNGIPTYHFAHVVDDHLMRTTHVTRGEEWLSTAPLHLQLFEMFGFEIPVYLHFSHIGKMEGNSVRKLSKRKDPEAAMSFYTEVGYPTDAVSEYLLNLANSNFYDWRKQNPTAPHTEFKINPKKIGKSIALFDHKKLDDMSKDVIARMTATEVYDQVYEWANTFKPEFAEILSRDKAYAIKVFNVEREKTPPRKDFVTWSQTYDATWYFFDELFEAKENEPLTLPDGLSADDAKAVLNYYQGEYDETEDKEAWTERGRNLAEKLGFARDLKTYKADPDAFKGHVGHLMSVVRLALTRSSTTPDLHEIMQVMGKERVSRRISAATHQIL
ncbi:MAG TPA: glutamate--tRNA ligase family protein [Patescibacteria group bacterium]